MLVGVVPRTKQYMGIPDVLRVSEVDCDVALNIEKIARDSKRSLLQLAVTDFPIGNAQHSLHFEIMSQMQIRISGLLTMWRQPSRLQS